MDIIEMTGKTADDAVEKALKLLSAKRGDVIIEVLDEGSKGFLGLGQKPAKVTVTLKDDPVRSAKRFIRDVSAAMGMDVAVDALFDEDARAINIDMKGSNMGVLIGKHGQTLDALQYLTNLVVNKNTENFINIQLDTENYRLKRKEALEALARATAKKVRQTKRSVRLEPMSPAERRVIHATLQNEKQITTFSEGTEPFRNVVVAMKREQAQGDGKYQQNRPKPGDREKTERDKPERSRTERSDRSHSQSGYSNYSGKSQNNNRYNGNKQAKDAPKHDNYHKFVETKSDDKDDDL